MGPNYTPIIWLIAIIQGSQPFVAGQNSFYDRVRKQLESVRLSLYYCIEIKHQQTTYPDLTQ